MTLKPMADRVLLKATETAETTKSGIVLATANKEKPDVSVVVALAGAGGPGTKDVEMVVTPGDKVVVGKYTGTEIKLDSEDYTIVSQNDILAIVE